MTTPDRPLRPATVVGLLVLLLLVRSALVVSLSDVFFYGEELEKGTAAKALLDGVAWPYHQLAYHPYEGGGFVVSHLLALAFLLVGQSILAHKLVALGFGALLLCAGLRLCRRHFGRGAALCFGLLLVLGPASFQKLSLLSLGIHFEACLFLLLVLDATLTLLETPRGVAPPLRQAALLGLALGFGFYFNYQLAVAGLWSSAWLLARRPRVFTGRSLGVGLGALALGLLPLAAMASRVGTGVFDIHGTPLATVQSNFDLLADFVRSLYVGRSAGGLGAAILYPLALVVSLWVLGRVADRDEDPARRNAFRLVSFLLLWFAIYLTSGFVVGEVRHPFQLMRFAPVWVVAAVLIAAGVASALRSRQPTLALAGRALGLALLLAGVLATLSAVRAGSPATWRENVDQLAGTKGYDYAGYFAKVFPRLSGPAERELALTGFDEPQPELLCADYAQALSEHAQGAPEGVVGEVLGAWSRGPVGRHDAWKGCGPEDYVRGLGAYASRRAGRDIAAALALAGELLQELRPAWGQAVGRFGNAYAEFPGRIEAQLAALGEGPLREDFLRGVGYRIYRRFVVGPFGTVRFQLKPAAVRRWMESLPADQRPLLQEGFAQGVRLHRLP